MKTKKIFLFICILSLPYFVSGQKTDKQSDKKIIISGTVLSAEKKPVEGALFYVDNAKSGTKSKKDGSFKIKVSQAAHKITVKSAQYGSCEKEINSQTSIEFVLNGIAEYSSLKSAESGNRTQNTDSVKKTSKARPKKMNTYNDIYQMIRAEVPGVVVNGRSIVIQQGHSFFGSSEPLYVVNGAIVSSIDNIVPLEVKSINILKGSQAAIYGVSGSNGVVSITLKNGTENEK